MGLKNPQYATLAMSTIESTDEGLRFEIADHESLCFHNSREDAVDSARNSITSGDQIIALLKVEHLYRLKSVEIEIVKI